MLEEIPTKQVYVCLFIINTEKYQYLDFWDLYSINITSLIGTYIHIAL